MISYWSILNSIALISFGIWESRFWSIQPSKETQKLLQKTEDSYQYPTPEKQNKTIYHFVLDINQENCLITIKGEIEHSSQLNKALKDYWDQHMSHQTRTVFVSL